MIHGKNRIGHDFIDLEGPVVRAYSPMKGEYLPGTFQPADTSTADMAVHKASVAFEVYSKMSGTKKADFLEVIADEILSLGDALVQRAVLETALPEARIVGERGRTVNQLRLFAQLLREGSWVEASIDTALPDREPLSRPDIRKMHHPVGPVVIFTASNFPLAFSTAGGDTASALAAGNPVIIKAHESHLGTNELVVNSIIAAAKKTGMPDGVFSSLVGSGYELGQFLVKHTDVKSVAFTGSFSGGMALYKIAQQRPNPIPVFSEMGSINPVFLLPGKLKADPVGMAKALAGSITLGVGQFCTNPGVIVGLRSGELSVFSETLAGLIGQSQRGKMLNENIARSYDKNVRHALKQSGVVPLVALDQYKETQGVAVVATVGATEFIQNPELSHEVFGPFSLVVECQDDEELQTVINSLAGQLTCTIMANNQDVSMYEGAISTAAKKCGRLIFNDVPTGVEVCHSIVHGGPFPASTDARFTSVGTDAIKRFVRPVCYQDAPDVILPDELKDSNPLGIWRKVNGQMSRSVVDDSVPV